MPQIEDCSNQNDGKSHNTTNYKQEGNSITHKIFTSKMNRWNNVIDNDLERTEKNHNNTNYLHDAYQKSEYHQS
ncbi:hypothetical protein ADQ49_13810 [Salmonella enterica subsp. enterica]|nr:hypothetical protein [Salmonella enterica subsp. enterica serovar Enteritidis]